LFLRILKYYQVNRDELGSYNPARGDQSSHNRKLRYFETDPSRLEQFERLERFEPQAKPPGGKLFLIAISETVSVRHFGSAAFLCDRSAPVAMPKTEPEFARSRQ
jgi:hypothetical protein